MLAHETGQHPGPAEHAAAGERVYGKICLLLAPIVGLAGVQALFARSVKVAKVEHAFFRTLVTSTGQPEDLGRLLRNGLPAQDPEAAVTLFATFFELLAAIIGEGLVAQLLEDAWPRRSGPAPDERNR